VQQPPISEFKCATCTTSVNPPYPPLRFINMGSKMDLRGGLEKHFD